MGGIVLLALTFLLAVWATVHRTKVDMIFPWLIVCQEALIVYLLYIKSRK